MLSRHRVVGKKYPDGLLPPQYTTVAHYAIPQFSGSPITVEEDEPPGVIKKNGGGLRAF